MKIAKQEYTPEFHHQLPELYLAIKDDCRAPYASLLAAYREILPAIWRQIRAPGYFVKRSLPDTANRCARSPTATPVTAEKRAPVDGWIAVCAADALVRGNLIGARHADSRRLPDIAISVNELLMR